MANADPVFHALGYYLALKAGVKFLTGDKWFKELDGVEFVV